LPDKPNPVAPETPGRDPTNPLRYMSLHDRPYGVGLAYRFSVHEEVLAHRDEIDLLEISTEDYIVRERRIFSDPDESKLRDILGTIPCVAHGISLSIGSVEPLDRAYLEGTRTFLEENGIGVFSEHLAYHRMDGNDLTMFLAMPFEEVSIQWLKQNYFAVRQELGRPFALENVTYHFPVPHCSLSEADFLRRLTEETDCTLLLDVTNVFNNAHNHGYDPVAFLDRLPMERVSQMHLAGGHKRDDGKWEDSHSAPVMDPVWPLFEEAVQRAANVECVILERDSRLEPFFNVMEDIRKAREIFYRHKPRTSGVSAPPPIAAMEKGSEPAWEAGEFEDLRAYQRTMMGRISDPAFREEFLENAPTAAAERYRLTDPQWLQRVLDSDGASMHHLASAWDYFRDEDEVVEEEYKDREWAMWAEQM